MIAQIVALALTFFAGWLMGRIHENRRHINHIIHIINEGDRP